MAREGEKGGGNVYQFRPVRARGMKPLVPRLDEGKTLLVVDDQHVVLELVDAFLEDRGYKVYLAGSGGQALEICERLNGAVDLLLTDVRMPGMNGPELYDRLVGKYPGVKVLYMSGFAATEAGRFGVSDSAQLIVKPFKPQELLQQIRLSVAGVLQFPSVAAD